jgi:hypothetical protein
MARPARMSQRSYARQRGCSVQAVNAQTVGHGGPIPTYGPAKQIDPDEVDRLWPRAPASGPVGGDQLRQARAAALVMDVQTKRLALEQRRGALISRDRAVTKAFSFARMLRDAWLTWPARIGPQLAADLGVEPAVLVIMLEDLVRAHLEELASERCEF